MREFSILRYLKQFSLLIFLFSVVGALAIYFYGNSQQRYIASTVIRYTNEGAKDGFTPDGSPLNVEEIYSSTVIDAALADLGYHSNIDSVRSNCYVEEVISEKQQELNEALLKNGEEPSYLTDTYRVYYIGNSDAGENYAWNMLDAIIKTTMSFTLKGMWRSSCRTTAFPRFRQGITTIWRRRRCWRIPFRRCWIIC